MKAIINPLRNSYKFNKPNMKAEEFYKKHLAYRDIDLDKESPLTHKGVIHLLNTYKLLLNMSVDDFSTDQLQGELEERGFVVIKDGEHFE